MRWMLIAVVVALGAGCRENKPAEGEPPPMVEPMGEGEAELGKQACNAYVEQVCACVAKVPELKAECEMARARPNAFELNTRAAMAQGDANSKDRRSLAANARKIMRSCIEDASELVKQGCPMATPGGATGKKAPGTPAPDETAPATPAVPAPPAPAPAK
jgi:hypothetical protein